MKLRKDESLRLKEPSLSVVILLMSLWWETSLVLIARVSEWMGCLNLMLES